MIYRYNEYEHPAGFIGLRVAVSIDGYVKQKYFNFRKKRGLFVSTEEELKLIEKATKLDKKWRNQQAKMQRENKRNAIPRKNLHTTRVRGISMIASSDRKYRCGRMKIYPYIALSIHISHKGEVFTTTIRLKKDGSNLKSVWKKAIDMVCKKKKMRNNQQLYQRQPTKKEVLKLAPPMAKEGLLNY